MGVEKVEKWKVGGSIRVRTVSKHGQSISGRPVLVRNLLETIEATGSNEEGALQSVPFSH